MKLIEIVDLEKNIYGTSQCIKILSNLNLSIDIGDTIAILGTSGAGKTTLLSILAGLDTASKGEVRFKGQDMNQLSEDERAKLRLGQVGFIFQSFYLLPQLTALENVRMALEFLDGDNNNSRCHDALQSVGLHERMNHYPNQLSGGEQQRVAIARAFVTKPSILFADEPTGNLDEKTSAHIMDLLFDLNVTTKTTIVLVTHDRLVAKRCNKQYELKEGRLEALDII